MVSEPAPAAPESPTISPLQRAQSIIESLPVPEGTFAVGAGLAVAGVTTYLFQILAFRGLSKPDYGALNALWVFVFVLAPGIFLPVEQEVGRAIAARRAHGIGGGPVARRAGILGLGFAVTLGLVTIVVGATTSVVDNLFAGNTGLIACLVIALFTFGFELLARGVFAGAGAFGAYGVSMGAEGVIRLIPCIALAAAGVTNPVYFGLCLALPPALATLDRAAGPDRPRHARAPGAVVGAVGQPRLPARRSLLAQMLSYAPFLGAQLLATPGERVRRRRLHRRPLPVAHPDPALPGGAGGAAAAPRRARQYRATTSSSAPACASSSRSSSGSASSASSAARRSGRSWASCCSATSSSSAASTSGCSRRAAGCSSWR